MILYAILNKLNGYIYFSGTSRLQEEQENTELLWTSEIRTFGEVRKCLRPWICLWDEKYYKNVQEIEEFMSGKPVEIPYSRVWKSEIDSEISKFIDDFTFLQFLGCIPQNLTPHENMETREKIKYDCDIINYLEDIFGKTYVDIVYLYKKLDKKSKEFLKTFSDILTKDKKSEYIKTNIQNVDQTVLEFLPLWFRLDYKLSGSYGNKNNIINSLEYNTPKHLGDTGEDIERKLRSEFYETFKLDSVYTGQETKTLIQTIYNSLGIKRTAKITDLSDYFEITKVNSGNESSYRIDLRKIKETKI